MEARFSHYKIDGKSTRVGRPELASLKVDCVNHVSALSEKMRRLSPPAMSLQLIMYRKGH